MEVRRVYGATEFEAKFVAEFRQRCRLQHQQRLEAAELSTKHRTPIAVDQQTYDTQANSTGGKSAPSVEMLTPTPNSREPASFATLPGELRNQIYSYLHYSNAEDHLILHREPTLRISTRRTVFPNKQYTKEFRDSLGVELERLFKSDHGSIELPSGKVVSWAYINDDNLSGGRHLYLIAPVTSIARGQGMLQYAETGIGVFWKHGGWNLGRVRQTSLHPDYQTLEDFAAWLDSKECAAHKATKMHKELKAMMKLIDRLSRNLPGISAPPARAIREHLKQEYPDVQYRWSYAEVGMMGAW